MKPLKTEVAFATPWFQILGKTMRHGEAPYYSLKLPDYAAVVAVTEEQRVLIVRQYRPAVERDTLELPSGMVDPGETPEAAVTAAGSKVSALIGGNAKGGKATAIGISNGAQVQSLLEALKGTDCSKVRIYVLDRAALTPGMREALRVLGIGAENIVEIGDGDAASALKVLESRILKDNESEADKKDGKLDLALIGLDSDLVAQNPAAGTRMGVTKVLDLSKEAVAMAQGRAAGEVARVMYGPQEAQQPATLLRSMKYFTRPMPEAITGSP